MINSDNQHTSRPLRRHLRRAGALLSALTAAAAISISAAAPASAACMAYGMGFKNINIQEIGTTGTYWNGILDQATSNWNNTSAGTSLRQVYRESGGQYTAGRYGSTSWNAIYTPKGTKGYDRTFLIQINADMIEERAPRSKANTNFGHWNRVLTVHEIGHALSLPDNPSDKPSDKYSIMTNPPETYYMVGSIFDWGYYSLPTDWDASQVRRCS